MGPQSSVWLLQPGGGSMPTYCQPARAKLARKFCAMEPAQLREHFPDFERYVVLPTLA